MKAVYGVAATLFILMLVDSAQARTVEEELRHLLETHPQLEAARKQLDVRKERVTVAKSKFFPRVDLLGDVGYEDINKPNSSSTGLTRKTGRIRVSQNVFSGFRNPGNLEIANIDEFVAERDLTGITQTLIFSGYEIYFDVIATRELTKLSGENVESIRTQLKLEDERVRRGAGASIDVLFAKSRLQVARENQTFFRGRFEDALVRYQRIFGRVPNLDDMPVPALPDDLIPATLDEAIEIAREKNPALQAANALIERASEQQTVAEADLLPELDIVAESNFEDDFDGTEGLRRDYFVGLRARWNLFSGFGTQAAVSAARINKFATQDEAANTSRGIVEDVGRAWENMETAQERVDLLENAVDIAEEVFDVRRRLREQGRDTQVNVLDAQQELFRAQIQLVEAEFVAQVARYRLLQSMGSLSPAVLDL